MLPSTPSTSPGLTLAPTLTLAGIALTDLAEDVIAKSQEYLESGCEEVWLVFPESRWIIVVTKNQRIVFISGEVVNTQTVLQGFTVAVDELLA